MGRMYTIPINGTASPATAAFDLFELKSGSAMAFVLHEVVIAQSSDTDSEQREITISRATGSYTSGSGGSAPTPSKLLPGDAAATVTAEVMNTTQAAAGSGALTKLLSDACNVLNGFHYLPTPQTRITFGLSEVCVIAMGAGASDALTIDGYAIIEEIL